ncbi:MAG: YdeI family protein [Candidatus Hodarchaeota archaeon]
MKNSRHFRSISEWRSWLDENHAEEQAIWLIIQKKASTKPGIHYEDAVLEAIAYGWIDGKMHRLNDDEFVQLFTPRRRNSVWSLNNRGRAERLISEGRMTPAGLRTVEEAKQNGRWDTAYSSRRGAVSIPRDVIEALKKNKEAHENFESFPPSARFMYIHWINEAKRRDTRERRIFTVVDRSEKNLRPGIDLRVKKVS